MADPSAIRGMYAARRVHTRKLQEALGRPEATWEELIGEVEQLTARLHAVRALLDNIEGSYVGELNKILAASDGNSPDVHRGRGRAETLSLIASLLRISLDLPAVAYGSAEWRTANGVYTDEQVAKFRALDAKPAGDDGTCGDCADGRCHGGEPDECGCDRHDESTKDGAS